MQTHPKTHDAAGATPVHPLLDAAYRLADATADNVAAVAAELVAHRATLAELVDAVDTYRAAEHELSQLLSLRLVVNGRRYTLRRPVQVGGR